MRVNNISNNVNFGKIYAVAGTRKQADKLKKIIEKSYGNGMYIDATNLYKNRIGKGLCTQAANRGKKIGFVVTGKADTNKVRFMESGLSTINGISQNIDEFISLHNVHSDAKKIKKAMRQYI